MTELYQPSNGDEGIGFISEWCDNCEHDRAYREDPDDGQGCEILAKTMVFDLDDPEYPKEWIIASDGPKCTAFEQEHHVLRVDKIAERDDRTVDMFESGIK